MITVSIILFLGCASFLCVAAGLRLLRKDHGGKR